MITADYICLVAGPIIALLVSAFKRLAIVSDHPKVVAAILSAVTAIVSGLSFHELDWTALAQCLIFPFTSAVATYEVVKSASKGSSP